MKIPSLSVAAAGLALMMSASASAHHSFAAEFDRSKPVTLTGTITKLEWSNPHARFQMDVKEADGSVANWDFELASPNGLMRRGWTRKSLQPGDVITVTGFAAKNSPHVGNASTVTLASGKKVFAGSSSENEQNP